MGLFKVAGCIAGGVVAVFAAPTIIASAAVSTVGAAVLTGATALGASGAAAGAAATAAAAGSVGVAGAYATKKVFDHVEEKQEERDRENYDRGVRAGRKGEHEVNEALKREMEQKDEQIKKYESQRNKDKELLKEQDYLLYTCFEKYPELIDQIVNKFNLVSQLEEAKQYYCEQTKESQAEASRVIDKLAKYLC